MSRMKFIDILKTNSEIQQKVRKWRNKKEIKRYMISQESVSEKEHFGWLENLEENKRNKVWVVFVDDISIGTVYLKNIDLKSKCSEWGFYIGEDSFRGKGFGKRILYKLSEKYFEDMKFNKLKTLVLKNNNRALKIYDKFGFRKVNEQKIEDSDIVELEFYKQDWDKSKNRLKNENISKK
jgi:UDP-4-amino-4,6-dideoxy-N-acetyl-beta-L-altrosamine N-acetyltransferase